MGEPYPSTDTPAAGDPYVRLRAIVEAWQRKRTEITDAQPQDGDLRAGWLRDYTSVHNDMTRQLVRELGEQPPEFWAALRELSGNVPRVARGNTVWDQIKFWVRDFRDSFGHRGASEHWADELRQIRTDITRDATRDTTPKPRRRFWRETRRDDRSVPA